MPRPVQAAAFLMADSFRPARRRQAPAAPAAPGRAFGSAGPFGLSRGRGRLLSQAPEWAPDWGRAEGSAPRPAAAKSRPLWRPLPGASRGVGGLRPPGRASGPAYGWLCQPDAAGSAGQGAPFLIKIFIPFI